MERKVTVVTEVKGQSYKFEVDQQKLANALTISEEIARVRGVRPGQPVDLTKTPSDPISHEKCTTLHVILNEYRRK